MTGAVLAAMVSQPQPGEGFKPSGTWPADRHVSPAEALPVLNPDQMQHIVAALENARRYADSTVAGYFRDQLATYAVSDGMRGPKETLPLVLAIIAAAVHAAREARPSVRRELLAVGARSAEFAGWLYRDSAALRLAGYWHDRAVEWAQMAGEPALQGYVLLKKSQAAWDERDAPRMLMLARAARHGPWVLPPWVQAEAIQQEARAEAMLGADITTIAASLDEARRVPHLWWRLRGRPYGAVVVDGDTFDGLAWVVSADRPEHVVGIEFDGGGFLPATGLTLGAKPAPQQGRA